MLPSMYPYSPLIFFINSVINQNIIKGILRYTKTELIIRKEQSGQISRNAQRTAQKSNQIIHFFVKD